MKSYDVMFIGSGHAIWHAALTLAQNGKQVAIVEKDLLAGTCTNYGCNAKYLLDSPFEFADGFDRYKEKEISQGHFDIDWERLMAYKKEIIPSYAPGLESLLSTNNVDILRGHGFIKSEHIVEVSGRDYETENIVIATGQRSARLQIKGKEYLHDSRDFLDQDKMPKRIVFIGAGIISMEFATMAIKLGSDVHVIEYADKALANYNQEEVSLVLEKMEKEGVHFHFNQAVSEVEKTESSYKVKTKEGLLLETDYVLDATGRVSNVENIGLETAGVAYNRNGIEVNDHLQTNIPTIFASGDVIDKTIPRLTPTATFESNYIAKFILGEEKEAIHYPVVPNLVFTLPRIAQVGVTLAQAKENEKDYRIVKVPLGQTLKFQTKLEDDLSFTFIIDKDNKLVGASSLGTDAGEMINFLTLVINQRMSGKDLDQMIFAFPAVSYAMISTLSNLLR